MIVFTNDEIEKLLPFDKGESDAGWLETNGLGGWSSSSVIGCNTRRYHGLLVAATVPPAERMNLVSKLDETIVVDDERFPLSTNNYGGVISPTGFKHIASFSKGLFPEWLFEAGPVQLKKSVAMVHGANTTLILYTVVKSAGPFVLELLPLLAVRGYHNLMHANTAINTRATFANGVLTTQAYQNTPQIFIKIPGATFVCQPNWYYNFTYNAEQARGLDCTEDLFTPGKFLVELSQGDSVGIIVSTDDPAGEDAHVLFMAERQRRKGLTTQPFTGGLGQMLALAADQFIVKRSTSLKTVIAGYHWFTDWGRDTMISLPGLCLSTGRFEDAKKILSAFAQSVSSGMLPNRFQDNGEPPEYNNVDGTLWYFVAVYKYLHATNDREFVLAELLPVLKTIIDWHFKGTRYNIHVAADGLVYAGDKGQQLTWMDARIGDWVVTPRMGKPVEIEALWFNALLIFAELLTLNGQRNDAGVVRISAEKAKKSFANLFWYSGGNFLYDVIDEHGRPDASLRPNQLFAVSLPFALLEGEKAVAVLDAVTKHLYTPVGLRSLSPDGKGYIGIYEGNPYNRDSAYHQGTVWSWLLGPYIDALVKVNGDMAVAKTVLQKFSCHLQEACVGSVSEIFDGDAPHKPKGCVAQAWGVAEVLRVITDYNLW